MMECKNYLNYLVVALNLAVILATIGCGSFKYPESAEPLTVAAYNIRHGRGMDQRVDLIRTASVLQPFGASLIALQEVDSVCVRSGSSNQAAVLAESLGMYHAFGAFMPYDGGKYGMAVLSAFPILETYRHILPEGAEPRCALEVVVEYAPKRRLSFVSIHNDWTEEQLRLPQVKELIRALSARRHPVILAGDFNTTREGASLALLRKAGFVNDEKWRPTFPSLQPEKEIDFIMVRGFSAPARVEVVKDILASDHCLIWGLVK
jgi:endonuclease/exonuclease/phosphatase family metal-dependent hydrolase